MKTLAPIFFSLILSMLTASAYASTPLEMALRERLDTVQTYWDTAHAERLVKEIYTADIQITGEGNETFYEGTAAVTELVKGLIADNKKVQIDLNRVQQTSADTALSWVTWTVTPAADSSKPFNMKSLFVWKKSASGWRIVADMYAVGVIPAK